MTEPIAFYCDGDTDGAFLAAVKAALPGHDVVPWPGEPTAAPATARHVIVWQPPADFFAALPAVEHVHVLGAGVNQLLDHPGLPDGAAVYRLEDAGMGEQMSEYVLYGVLQAHRRMLHYRVAAQHSDWQHGFGFQPANTFTVGILGAGILGSQVGARLVANGYDVRLWSRTARELDFDATLFAGDDTRADFLSACNALVCLLPLTPATRHILDAQLFEQLPPGAFLINPGRGDHLLESDLIPAITRGQLSGALLDVFATEPLPADHPFWSHPRIDVTPHIAATSPMAISAAQIAANITRLEAGGEAGGLVDRQRGY